MLKDDINKLNKIEKKFSQSNDRSEKKKLLDQIKSFEFNDEVIAETRLYNIKYKDGKINSRFKKLFAVFDTLPFVAVVILWILPLFLELGTLLYTVSTIFSFMLFIFAFVAITFQFSDDGVIIFHKYIYPNTDENSLENLDKNLRKEVNLLEDDIREELIDSHLDEEIN